MNVAIITGASSGLGKEFAKQYDALFHKMDEIWVIARRKERLEELRLQLHTRCRIITMDITNPVHMAHFKEVIQIAAPEIRILVNAAGFGLVGDFKELPLKEQMNMIRLNCEALTQFTGICLPYMHRNTRIVQVASSAGFMPQPTFAVYAATKAYVLSYSRALAEELRRDQIYVTAICPGPVDTEFFHIAEKYGTAMAVKKLSMVSAHRVVKKAIRDSYHKKQMSVCSLPIRLFHGLTAVVPHGLMMRMMRMF